MMLLIAFKDCSVGVPVQFRTVGNVFNLCRFQSHTKTFQGMVRDLLYADDFSTRLSKASSAFGRLTKRLWNDHGIRLDTKVAILTSLLYGSESWVLYRELPM